MYLPPARTASRHTHRHHLERAPRDGGTGLPSLQRAFRAMMTRVRTDQKEGSAPLLVTRKGSVASARHHMDSGDRSDHRSIPAFSFSSSTGRPVWRGSPGREERGGGRPGCGEGPRLGLHHVESFDSEGWKKKKRMSRRDFVLRSRGPCASRRVSLELWVGAQGEALDEDRGRMWDGGRWRSRTTSSRRPTLES